MVTQSKTLNRNDAKSFLVTKIVLSAKKTEDWCYDVITFEMFHYYFVTAGINVASKWATWAACDPLHLLMGLSILITKN